MTELVLRLTGASLIALAGLHFFLPKRFRWKEEMARVSLLNRQIFYVHCIFICLVLVLMGLLCLAAPGALTERTDLGGWVAAGFAFFWFCRLVCQWFVYDRVLWRGKRFETLMHWLFTALWLAYTAVFGWVAWGQFR